MNTRATYIAARNIYCAAEIDKSGWKLSVFTYKCLRIAICLLLFTVVGIVSTIAIRKLQEMIIVDVFDFAIIVALVIGFYIFLGHAVKELLTIRQIYLSNHPLRAVFRALDIPKKHVIIAESLDRLAIIMAITSGICWTLAILLMQEQADWRQIVILVLYPIAITGFSISATCVAAVFRYNFPNKVITILIGVGVGALSALTIKLAVSTLTINVSDLVLSIDIDFIRLLLFVVVLILAAISISGLIFSWRKLSRSHFLIEAEVPDSFKMKPLRTGKGIQAWLKIIASELAIAARVSSISRSLLLVYLVGTAIVGIKFALPELTTLLTSNTTAVTRVFAFSLFTISGFFAEQLSKWIGPATLATRLRSSWELGEKLTILSIIPIGVALFWMLVLSLPLLGALFSLGGDVLCSLSIAISAISLSWISFAIVPVRINSDGTVEIPLSAAFFNVIMLLVVLMLACAFSVVTLSWVSLLLSILLLGGAIWTSKNRILTLVSRPIV